MDKLPQEVFDLIVQRLGFEELSSPLSKYATISRQWQYAVERRVFANLSVYANEMPMLESILRSSRRREYLRSLKYRIRQACWDRPNSVSRLRKSRQRTVRAKELNLIDELKRLWNLLSLGWGSVSERTPSLMLSLEISEPRNQHRSVNNLRPNSVFKSPDLPWTRMMLPGVKALSVSWGVINSKGFHPAHVSHPPWLFSLLATCPSAAEVTWSGFEPYLPAAIVGTGYRERMAASAAAAGTLGNLQHLRLHFDTSELSGRKQNIDACRQGAPGTLNRVLHKLSQQLVTLHLTGLFLLSPDLFWPKTHDSGSKTTSTSTAPPTPFWPYLQQIHIEARLASPEGRFYFDPATKPTDYRACWYTYMVANTDASAAGDLLVRATRAMLQMPELRKLSVTFPESPRSYRDQDRVLIRCGRGWTVAEGRGWQEPCHTLGRCVGCHNGCPQPWYWYWNAPCPTKVATNYGEFMARMCQTAS